jgi:hypothetical protein
VVLTESEWLRVVALLVVSATESVSAPEVDQVSEFATE